MNSAGGRELASIQILIAGMPQFAADVIRGTLRGQADIQLVNDDCSADALLAGQNADVPDVVIVELDEDGIPAFCAPLLYSNPRLKVLAISATDHDTVLYELRPHKVALGNVTPRGLVDAIRDSFRETQ